MPSSPDRGPDALSLVPYAVLCAVLYIVRRRYK
jgi:hypothetical protein